MHPCAMFAVCVIGSFVLAVGCGTSSTDAPADASADMQPGNDSGDATPPDAPLADREHIDVQDAAAAMDAQDAHDARPAIDAGDAAADACVAATCSDTAPCCGSRQCAADHTCAAACGIAGATCLGPRDCCFGLYCDPNGSHCRGCIGAGRQAGGQPCPNGNGDCCSNACVGGTCEI
jgi:hypothetical protein